MSTPELPATPDWVARCVADGEISVNDWRRLLGEIAAYGIACYALAHANEREKSGQPAPTTPAFRREAMFKFDLKQVVKIEESGEVGTVIGRCDYVAADNNYFLRYKAADGRAVEAWWTESALSGQVV